MHSISSSVSSSYVCWLSRCVLLDRPSRFICDSPWTNLRTQTLLYIHASPSTTSRARLINRVCVHLVETELSVLTRQCLDRRIPDRDTLVDEVSTWGHDRNVNQSDIDWQFTTDDARIKLKRLYPAT